MHHRDCEVDEGFFNINSYALFIFGGIYSSISLGFLICPCNEPLVGDTQTGQF